MIAAASPNGVQSQWWYTFPVSHETDGPNLASAGDDVLSLSSEPELMKQFGLQPSSCINVSDDRIEFKLDMSEKGNQTLSASGVVSTKENQASLSLTYDFSQSVLQNGTWQTKRFEFTINITSKLSSTQDAKPFKNKEDIVGFISRVVNDVVDAANTKGIFPAGVLFDQDDLAEAAGIDNGKMLKMLMEFVATISLLARMRNLTSADKATPVYLFPKRQSDSGISVESQSNSSLDCTFSLKELSSDGGESAAGPASSVNPAQSTGTESQTAVS